MAEIKDNDMKKQNGFTVVELLVAVIGLLGVGGWIANIVKLASSSFDPLAGMVIIRVIGLLGVGGWIANIVKLASSSFDPLTGMVIIRAIGVFVAPLGSVMGFL